MEDHSSQTKGVSSELKINYVVLKVQKGSIVPYRENNKGKNKLSSLDMKADKYSVLVYTIKIRKLIF